MASLMKNKLNKSNKSNKLNKTQKSNNYFSDNMVIFGLIVVLLIVIVMRLYRRTSFEMFQNNSSVYGNLLIERECNNLTISGFKFDTDKRMILNEGIKTIIGSQCELLVDCLSKKRLEAINLDGVDNYEIHYSQDDKSYTKMNEFINQIEPLVLNLSDKNGIKVTARYYKIIFKSNNEKNIKFELYGVNEGDEQGINMVLGDSMIFNKRVDVNYNYNDDWNSTISTYFSCVMENNMDHLISYIKFNGNFEQCKIYVLNKFNNKPFILPCSNEKFNCFNDKSFETTIYLPNKMLVNKLYVVPLDSDDKKILTLENFEIIGQKVLESDMINYKEVSTKCDKYGILDIIKEDEEDIHEKSTNKKIKNNNTINNVEKESLRNTNILEGFSSDDRLINSFNNVNKLCEAIEYQEKIKNEKEKLEKNKIYMNKLLEQEQEINKLTTIIKELQKQRQKRVKMSDVQNMAMYKKQKEMEAKVTDLVNNRLENQKKMEVRVNLKPSSN